ncbi:MAG: HIT family protein [Mycoplasmataceae bacterium]|jgi:histidine triad (HIT) family protein|nr:HIT family protein [Mycoplasmataceae bacterium]
MDCIFCKIANGEIPCKKVAENDLAVAFLDLSPVSDGHTLVIPKKHSENLSSTDEEVLAGVFALVKEVTKKIYNSSLKPVGFNYVSNEGSEAGQMVFHFHVHVIPKYNKEEGFLGTCKPVTSKSLDEVLEKINK